MGGRGDGGDIDFVGVESFEFLLGAGFFLFGEEGRGVCHCQLLFLGYVVCVRCLMGREMNIVRLRRTSLSCFW